MKRVLGGILVKGTYVNIKGTFKRLNKDVNYFAEMDEKGNIENITLDGKVVPSNNDLKILIYRNVRKVEILN